MTVSRLPAAVDGAPARCQGADTTACGSDVQRRMPLLSSALRSNDVRCLLGLAGGLGAGLLPSQHLCK